MKQNLRKFIRSRKASVSPEHLNELSETIIAKLQDSTLFSNAKTVLLYHSLPDEVCTHRLIQEACENKTVLLPTVVGDELELHIYTPSSATHNGSFNITESEGPLFTDFSQIDLAIIPGMAFDEAGNRLGRGKGYYDRLLPHLQCPLVGICFPFQLLDSIPTEPHDRKVDIVITA